VIAIIAVVGLRTMHENSVSEQPEYRVTILETAPKSIEEPTNDNAVSTKPEMPKGNGGGGGGGQRAPLPPSAGVLPPIFPGPQIVKMNPSDVPEPTLAVTPTVVGPAGPPPPPGPIGDPTGKSRDFSAGPGDGGGLGSGAGTGVGAGKDNGALNGSKGAKGGGPAGSPDGSDSECLRFWFGLWFNSPATSLDVDCINAIITEAQENKVTALPEPSMPRHDF
jgi:hypothetical protein